MILSNTCMYICWIQVCTETTWHVCISHIYANHQLYNINAQVVGYLMLNDLTFGWMLLTAMVRN